MYCDLWKQYIQVRKLLKGGNYSRAETIGGNTVSKDSTPEKCKPIVFGKESLVCREGKAGKAPPKVPREID